MNELSTTKYTFDELLVKKHKRRTTTRVTRYSLSFALCAVVIASLFLYNTLSGHNIAITVTAYAAENTVELSNKFVDFELSAMPVDGSANDYNCYINYNLFFRCEGQDIKSITYTCSDQEVTRNNRAGASAYYVENMILPLNEYSNQMQENDFLYGYYAPGEDTAHMTRLIGNSYTVSYEDQNTIQYGLIIAATSDHSFQYSIEETVITLDIYFNDGSVQRKEIIIKSSQDAFSDIQIRIQ
jgi:hypothetical protein